MRAGLVLIGALALPGCVSGEVALSREEFVTQAGAVCAQLAADNAAIRPPASPDDLTRVLGELVAPSQRARDALAALVPPVDGLEVRDALVEGLDLSLASIRSAQELAAAGDVDRADERIVQASREVELAAPLADAYGLAACGSG